jgi:hypothetical protein
MSDSPSEQTSAEAMIIESLRRVLAPLTARLTPDVEPATIYTPFLLTPAKTEIRKEDR